MTKGPLELVSQVAAILDELGIPSEHRPRIAAAMA